MLCKVKNLTLRVDEAMLSEARQAAAKRGTSVNALIREYLGELARDQGRRRQARKEILELCGKSAAQVGERNWTRGELYER
ncbi:MAG: ribbon-helix-helix protein, CopG family [Puniceicoccaceae bacterium]|nr:MAG: ribbon-helix-helix protein, CopG family [Puniceicoccaceae bacterium]